MRSVRRSDKRAPLAAAAFGIVWWIHVAGIAALNPTNLGWIEGGDMHQHLVGWLFYRHAPWWSLPLGRLDDLATPVGTTIGFNDANPLMALFFRAWSWALPVDFQYIGLWLAVCFALQGWFGARLAGLFTRDRITQALGGMFFVLAPVLLFRLHHENLCAHWMILAFLWLNLRGVADAAAARRALAAALLVDALATGTHPFLAGFTLPLTAALIVRLVFVDGLVTGPTGLLYGVAAVAISAGELALFGYLDPKTSCRAFGFGFYSADLLALVNPMEWHRLLPALPSGKGQYEGFGYVGSGTLFLLIPLGLTLIGHAARRRMARLRRMRVWPLALVTLALFAVALSSRVTWLGRPIADLSRLYRPFLPLIEPFRSSGRFVWLTTYFISTLVLGATIWLHARRPRRARALIAAALLLQIFELAHVKLDGRVAAAPRDPMWARLDGSGYRQMALYPPTLIDANGWHCPQNPESEGGPMLSLAIEAYRAGLRFNSGYLSRFDEAAGDAACRAAVADHSPPRFDTVYIARPEWVARLRARGAICRRFADRFACVTPERHDPFADWIREDPR